MCFPISKAMQTGDMTAKEFATGQRALASAIKSSASVIQSAAINTARVTKIQAETNKTNRMTEIALSEASARATVRAENEKQKALRATTSAGQAASKAMRDQQGRSSAAGSAMGWLPEQGADNRVVGSSFGTMLPKGVLDPQLKAAEQATRSYANASTISDNAIKAQTESGKEFSKGLKAQMQAQGDNVGSLNQTRYAMYDVANTLGILGAALTAAGGAAATFGVQYESAMTNLERATQLETGSVAANQLKNDLISLSQDIPVGFGDLAGIATLGAQLGIANEDLENFTETTAQFAAVTGVSTDKVAQDFGALSALIKVPSTQFKNLASAINFVGINSVATDAEILNLSTSIGASAAQADFGAANIVGLSAALASLRIQPEQARGVILRLFADFDKVTSEGGKTLDVYAKVLGTTTAAAQELWNTDSEQFVSSLLKGLGAAENMNATLTELGIVETRERNVLQRLASSYDLYTDSITQANSAYTQGTFLGDSYGKVADDIATKLGILGNKIQNLLAKAGGAILPVLGPVLDVIGNLLGVLDKIPAPVLGVITAFTLLAGGLALVLAGGAALVATGLAMQTAMKGLTVRAGETVTLMVGLRQAVTGTATAMGVGSAATRINTATLGSLAIAARGAAVGLYTAATASRATSTATTLAAFSFRGLGAAILATPLINIVAGLSIAIPVIMAFATAADTAKQRVAEMGDTFITAGGGADAFREALEADTAAVEAGAESLGTFRIKVLGLSDDEQKAADAAAEHKEAIAAATGAAENMTEATGALSEGLKDQSYQIGQNTLDFLRNAAASGEALKNIDALDARNFESMGFDFDEASIRALEEEGGAVKYAAEQYAAYRTAQGGIVTDKGMNESANSFGRLAKEIDAGVGKMENAEVKSQILGTGLGNLAGDADTAADSVDGLSESFIEVFAGNLLRGSKEFFGFDKIIDGIKETKTEADTLAKAIANGDDIEKVFTPTVNISEFAAGLQAQIDAQTNWAMQMGTLTERGATSFVSELAAMGPEGAALAAQAVALSSEELMKLEANARLAGFLASEGFAAGFAADQEQLLSAYDKGGLAAVQALIAAQISNVPGAVDAVIAEFDLGFSNKPITIPDAVLDANTDAADAAVLAFRQRVYDTPAVMNVVPNVPEGVKQAYANGGIQAYAKGGMQTYAKGGMETYANGGVRTGIYAGRNGGVIKFAEPETRWEAFISGKAGEEKRNLAIWGEAGKRLGVDYAPDLAASAADSTDSFSGSSSGPTTGSSFGGATASSPSGRVRDTSGPTSITNVQVTQNYPTTRDPLKKLREDSENLVAGLWSDN